MQPRSTAKSLVYVFIRIIMLINNANMQTFTRDTFDVTPCGDGFSSEDSITFNRPKTY